MQRRPLAHDGSKPGCHRSITRGMNVDFRFGMANGDGEHAVAVAVERLRGASLARIAVELPGAVALIASMHPEVRSELVAHTIADALGFTG